MFIADKEPPQVVYCPNDIQITDSNKRLVEVKWPEPIFKDNDRIAKLIQTHRIGRCVCVCVCSNDDVNILFHAEPTYY